MPCSMLNFSESNRFTSGFKGCDTETDNQQKYLNDRSELVFSTNSLPPRILIGCDLSDSEEHQIRKNDAYQQVLFIDFKNIHPSVDL